MKLRANCRVIAKLTAEKRCPHRFVRKELRGPLSTSSGRYGAGRAARSDVWCGAGDRGAVEVKKARRFCFRYWRVEVKRGVASPDRSRTKISAPPSPPLRSNRLKWTEMRTICGTFSAQLRSQLTLRPLSAEMCGWGPGFLWVVRWLLVGGGKLVSIGFY